MLRLLSSLLVLSGCTTFQETLNQDSKHPSPSIKRELSEELRLRAIQLKSQLPTLRTKEEYQKLRDSQSYQELQALAHKLQNYSLGNLSTREQKLAFWINVYNSLVVHAIYAYEPKKEVWDVSGFFDRSAYLIGGYRLSLYEIENGILRANRRPPYKWSAPFSKGDPRRSLALSDSEFDPRVHFALNCGSASCPPFAYFSADKVESQLQTAARGFLQTETQLKDGQIFTSKILDWYEGDFRPSVREYLLQFLEGDVKSALTDSNTKVRFKDYDWSLK